VRQLLELVHDGHLRLGDPILTDGMLIQIITTLPHQGANPNHTFVRKSQENNLSYQMKNDYDIVKKSRGYAIIYINVEAVNFSTSILARKIMRKCWEDEVSALVVSLAAQCSKGVQFNWVGYLYQEFLNHCCKK